MTSFRSTNSLLFFSFILVLWLSWPASGNSSTATSAPEDYIACLLDNSHPDHPISPAIFTPDNSSFTSVLRAYIRNNRFNTSATRKPFLIVTALHVSHIQASIVCARRHNMQMKIRSGGHDYEGVSYVAEVPFFILDMFNLRTIDIDIEKETAWVQTGATLGEVYYRIAEKSKVHGYPAGVCPTVGVGGHISGAGYGNLMRKYGLTVDNIEDATMVDVNGRLLDRKAMGEDLFWAISGGGGSSFGVVLSYKIKLVRVPEKVTVFRVTRSPEQNASYIGSRWQQVADKIDRDLFIRFIMDVVNNTQTGKKTARATFHGLFLGDADRLFSVLNTSFPELALKRSEVNETSWVQSVLFWTNYPIGTSEEVLLSRTPPVNSLKRKSDYVKKPISKEGLEWIWDRMAELEAPLALTFNPYGGRMAEIRSTAKPFPHRAGNLAKIQYAVNWDEQGTEAANYYIGLTRKLHMYMTRFVSANPREAFYNYKDLDLGINHNGRESYYEGRTYGIKYFVGNFNRLVEIKTRVDPDNFFRNEQSIPTLPHKK
ncbi:hypothetical protein TIFTF001_035145 [Ficus carica]|uniref:FAD-binding PCMH-type domain-containing protein n=1 Tax=Ficus carica TaxID=3494 RepID=A0AA88E1T4_FICCA|nr:hypothetical protein TIFTF001_035145 [Ficus carica]